MAVIQIAVICYRTETDSFLCSPAGSDGGNEVGMQVQTITYMKFLGSFVIAFKPMDTHMAEMKKEGWRVQSQEARPGRRGFLNTPDTLIVTYVKD